MISIKSIIEKFNWCLVKFIKDLDVNSILRMHLSDEMA